MNVRILLLPAAVLTAGLPGVHAARAVSDLQPPQKRQTSVELAQRLAQRTTPPPLPQPLPSPFNPPDFNKPEPGEVPAPTEDGPAVPLPPGDREILETVAAQLSPTGTIMRDNIPQLVMGSKRFQVGDRFIVTLNNADYELELVRIDRTTFTLRYRGEEITRPIKSVR